MNMRKSIRGFTLVEMVMVVAILSVVLTVISGLLIAGTRSYQSSMAYQQMHMRATKAVEDMHKELINCHVVAVGTDHTDSDDIYIEFQEPIILPDGHTDTAGADGVPGQTYKYQFKQQGADLSETTLGKDLNGDGDTSDSFMRGLIVREVWADPPGTDPESTTSLVGGWVIVPKDVLVGDAGRKSRMDLDGNGKDDRLFERYEDGVASASGRDIRLVVFSLEMFDGQPNLVHRVLNIYPVHQ